MLRLALGMSVGRIRLDSRKICRRIGWIGTFLGKEGRGIGDSGMG